MFTLPSHRVRSYLEPGRLSDVLALIQVLALDEHTHRQEGSIEEKAGLQFELQGGPVSAKSWTEVATGHPEFFRVRGEGVHKVSLLCRHVIPERRGRYEVPPELLEKLLDTANELHDRQVRLAERWTYLVPVWVAVIGAIAVIFAALLAGKA